MEKYAHIRRYPLRYADYDFQDELKPSSLLALAQEAAGSSADELGFGYEALKPQKLGFIVTHTYCEFKKPVQMQEAIQVETWPLPPLHVIFERDYRVTGANGEELALLASRWCLVDLQTFALCSPDRLKEVHENCPYRAEQAILPPSWKIPKLGEEGEKVRSFVITSGVCDHYFHANNTRYADFFFDCFSMQELSRKRLRAFAISYLKQIKEGEEITLYRKDDEEGAILEARVGQTLCSQCRIWWQK